MSMAAFTLTINARRYEVVAAPDSSLLEILRDRLHLTGTKRGCDIGVCGACTVLIGGVARRACQLRLDQVGQSPVTTIEGLACDGGALHPIQQAFIDAGAIQCGFCTPGMVLATKALLDRRPKPTREEIATALTPNLCRCTGYRQILEAVELAAARLRQSH